MDLKYILKDKRWKWLINKNIPEGVSFFYGVKSSKIYFDPRKPSRLPNANNIIFFKTEKEALDAGYRKSKRDEETKKNTYQRHITAIEKACELMEACEENINLDEISRKIGVSSYHFHRLFKKNLGVTPKDYLQAVRRRKVQEQINSHEKITDSLYELGFSSSSRFYENTNKILGMTPKKFKTGGKNETIQFSLGKCYLGVFLVAKSVKGVCKISLGDNPEILIIELQDSFPAAELIGGDEDFDLLVARVVGLIENTDKFENVPLDIRGTAFQQKVWKALQEIPYGQTATYQEIAQRIGMPSASRAVANACGANNLAIAVPCHRVIRSDGAAGGYRWGLDRKKELVNREKEVIKKAKKMKPNVT